MDLYISADAAEKLSRGMLGEKWQTTLAGRNRAKTEEHGIKKLGFRKFQITFSGKPYTVHVVPSPECVGMRNDSVYRKVGRTYEPFGKFGIR